MQMETLVAKVKPLDLPARIADWKYGVKHQPSLNDLVYEIHVILWDEDASYRNLLQAVWDADSVEGELRADDQEAARLIREKAKLVKSLVAEKNLKTITHCLKTVLSRFGASRKQRRDALGTMPTTTAGE